MSILIINILISIFLTIITLKSPIIITFNILILALITAWVYAFFIRAWYSYLIFLIYVGGILIMFAYFVALSPNQHLKIKTYISTLLFTLTIISFPSINTIDSITTSNTYYHQTIDLYFNFNIPILWLLILLLLFIILVITKIIYTSKGPLRPFLYV